MMASDCHRIPWLLKQLFLQSPMCVSEIKHFWDKPFSHRVPVKGYSRLDVQNMEELGMSNPLLLSCQWHIILTLIAEQLFLLPQLRCQDVLSA